MLLCDDYGVGGRVDGVLVMESLRETRFACGLQKEIDYAARDPHKRQTNARCSSQIAPPAPPRSPSKRRDAYGAN